MKNFWIKKSILFSFLFIAAILFFGFIVMYLWNAVLPAVLGVKAISFMQALGILLLSKILFGGFRGRGFRGRMGWKHKMKNRFENMSPEQKEQFKSEWKNRCGGRWKHNVEQSSNL